MKHFIKVLLLLLLPVFAYSQGGTWPVKYGDSDPSGAPSAAGTRLYFNTATNTLFTWEPAPSSTWRKQPKAFDQITGCAAPAYTPTARQSTFAVNSCTVPELYQWTGAAWVRLNEPEVYTAGTGIAISGGNEISNTAPDQTVTMTDGTGIDVTGAYPNFTVTNTAPNVVQTLSIAGQDLTLSGGGGTVAIPAGASDALGTGFTSGGGTGTIPAGTVANLTDNIQFVSPAGSLLSIKDNQIFFYNNDGGDLEATMSIDNGSVQIGADDLGTGEASNLVFTPGTFIFTASTNARFSSPVSTFEGGIQPVLYDNASAPNNCIFYSTTLSKLAYKDPGGTVNPLY